MIRLFQDNHSRFIPPLSGVRGNKKRYCHLLAQYGRALWTNYLFSQKINSWYLIDLPRSLFLLQHLLCWCFSVDRRSISRRLGVADSEYEWGIAWIESSFQFILRFNITGNWVNQCRYLSLSGLCSSWISLDAGDRSVKTLKQRAN